jgi:hypothetical protein
MLRTAFKKHKGGGGGDNSLRNKTLEEEKDLFGIPEEQKDLVAIEKTQLLAPTNSQNALRLLAEIEDPNFTSRDVSRRNPLPLVQGAERTSRRHTSTGAVSPRVPTPPVTAKRGEVEYIPTVFQQYSRKDDFYPAVSNC